jgi:hypothetical protein
MSMSEPMQQALDFAGQSGLVSSCQANGDGLGAGELAPMLHAQHDPQPVAAPAMGGGLRARATPPHPSRERHSPPSETRVDGGKFVTTGGEGGATGNRGLGMDADECARKLRVIALIRSIEELEGYSLGVNGEGGAAKRGYFEGEKAAIDTRHRQLLAATAVTARMAVRRA